MSELNQCPGAAPYRWLDDGHIETKGEFPIWPEGRGTDRIRDAWGKYGPLVETSAKANKLPVAWLMGIMSVESLGDPNACSPCNEELCPGIWNTGGCASQQCCAYGIMQIIDSTARMMSDGQVRGPDLLGRPDLSIDLAARYFRKLLDSKGQDPLAAAKCYNGCRGGVCTGGGMFGMGGQNNYVENFVRASNTFLSMKLVSLASVITPGIAAAALIAFGTLGYLGWKHVAKKYKIGAKLGLAGLDRTS